MKKEIQAAVSEFKDALLVDRIVARYKTAMEFPSEEALKKYLHDHPDADPSNHSVKKEDGGEKKEEGGDEQKPLDKTFKPKPEHIGLGSRLRSVGYRLAPTKGVREVAEALANGRQIPRKKLQQAVKELSSRIKHRDVVDEGMSQPLEKMRDSLQQLHDKG